ncbi:D-2-hydroxyacid dehydrogenase [Candidimonas sp. SYP-B2681]|uniref:D-2-hydroxyacid dehydrogenase n=1 Tax=Candidimonas sp. SYP-B2681 TaxID=2497686 RepID=UPI000F8716D4|nr:D-2-hydroxyacid dehydrogenase [Candidimonas sp. SYP-B2681]RTZ48072.1 D-2-hydroxyacid dehydrogenase [Candidimonas sp. SYP-B2681]
MAVQKLPPRDKLNVCFAHPSYRLLERFSLRETRMHAFEVRSHDELEAVIGEVDVLLISGMLWRKEYLELADRLFFLQSISAGMDQYDKAAFNLRDITLTSAQGTNANSVAEHALALMLAMNRKLHLARDNQRARHWRDPISPLTLRENELRGKTVLIVGFGRIGQRVASLAKAFDMSVIAIKRDLTRGTQMADEVLTQDCIEEAAARADFIVLTCPLTPETENLIDERVLRSMRSSAFLINVARGKVVHEPALLEALRDGRIAGAAVDCVWDEPLSAVSPMWEMDNLLITPHVGGETARFEDALLDLFIENLDRIYEEREDLINLVC